MPTHIVDVFDRAGKRVAIYPITLGALNYVPNEREYEQEALRCARADKVVPEQDFPTLTARVRV